MTERLHAAFKYLEELAIKYRAIDFIENKIILNNNQFHTVLNYFLDNKDYTMCTKLVNQYEFRRIRR